ncbi:HTH-type transcriptional regulator BetI [Mycobacterium shottsii]|uniref:Putative HTH-type transcriptional regulator n=1 Tax=Mycobacterium shottsii TaxID=133549 RepID=A0A7I7L5F8_9MYCO|nr:TetR/AcrR family transcriptional regulator [Mycobacterium shottsii]QYL30600.1 HTH-type transcriptional regulator BetI [Mycobacterium shottsii]BBX55034.1 putative HTH-type transcriptional regulator [Mycobacterium shottsii]
MSSDALVTVTDQQQHESGDRRRNRRQEETFPRVLAAGMDTLRASSYPDLTVRMVAARAGVSPATAYTYFSSKNHLIAEVYLDLVRKVPFFTDVNVAMRDRVVQALRHLALVVADEPEVGAACTAALLGGGADPAVRTVRDQIGAEIHRRIASAIGPGAQPGTIAALEMAFFGALVHAGSGEFTYHEVADRLADVAVLILVGAGQAAPGDDLAEPAAKAGEDA